MVFILCPKLLSHVSLASLGRLWGSSLTIGAFGSLAVKESQAN